MINDENEITITNADNGFILVKNMWGADGIEKRINLFEVDRDNLENNEERKKEMEAMKQVFLEILEVYSLGHNKHEKFNLDIKVKKNKL